MKVVVLIAFTLLSNLCFTQVLPLNFDDHNYQLEWFDEFNSIDPRVDPNKWKDACPWCRAGLDANDDNFGNVYNEVFGRNTKVTGGNLQCIIRKEKISRKYEIERPDLTKIDMTHNYYYSYGDVSTGGRREFGHGFFEARVKLPMDYEPNNFGNYFNAAFWIFGGSFPKDVAWMELDIFELVTDMNRPSTVPRLNNYTFNVHTWKPAGIEQLMKKWWVQNGGDPHKFNNQKQEGHFVLEYTDLEVKKCTLGDIATNFTKIHYKNEIDFADFHTFGMEWTPDQIIFYFDGKVKYKIEGDFEYKYPRHNEDCSSTVTPNKSIHPVSDLAEVTGGLIMGMGGNLDGVNMTNTNGDGHELIMYIDYFRYWKLKKECNVNIQPCYYNFPTQYPPTLHSVKNILEFGGTSTIPCDANFINTNQQFQVTLRATQDIKLKDGFKTYNEIPLYINKVDCNKLP